MSSSSRAKAFAKPYKTEKVKNMNTKWINNAIKSIGISSSKVFKDIAPNIFDASETVRSSAKSAKDLIRKNANINIIRSELEKNKFIRYGKKAIDNSLADLKSGKFNNQDRVAEEMEKEYNLDEFESSFGDIDSDVTINYNDTASSEATLLMNESINKQTESTLKASKATIDTIISVSSAGLLQNQQMGNEILNHLTNINSTLASMLSFQQENTLKMYETATAYFEKVGSKIDDNDSSSDDWRNGSRFVKNGFSTYEYKNYLKKSISKTLKDSPIGFMGDMLNDEDLLNHLVSNPLGMMTDTIVKKMIPNMIAQNIKSMDQAFADFMPEMLSKVALWKNDKNGGLQGIFKRAVGNIFGIDVKQLNSISSERKVNKDAAIFDKRTQNAVVEVIPKYLRESTAYLKTIAMHFDKKGAERNINDSDTFSIEKGGYIKYSDIDKDITNKITESVVSVFRSSEFGKAIEQGISELKVKDQKNFEPVLEQLAMMIENSSANINAGDLRSGSEMDNILKNINYKTKNQELLLREILTQLADNKSFSLSLGGLRLKSKDAFNQALTEIENNEYGNLYSSSYNNNDDIRGTVYKKKGYTKLFENQEKARKSANREEDKQIKEYEKGKKNLSRMSKNQIRNIAGSGISYNRYIKADQVSDEQDIITRTTGHIKNTMWGMMFGDPKTAMSEFSAIFTDQLKSLHDSMKKNFFNPLKESIFGKKNDKGYKENGLFASASNSFKDIMNEFKSQINGKEYIDSKGEKHAAKKESVISNMKNIFTSIRDGITKKLFGKKVEGDEDEKGEKIKKAGEKAGKSITGFIGTIRSGLAGWSEALFGKDPEKDEKQTADNIKKMIMDRMPDSITGGIVGLGVGAMSGGLLGTLIGGPLGGMAIGTLTGFFRKSERFQTFLFGEKDEETGERLGGIISNKVQTFVKENKNLLIGGAAVGMAKNVILGKSGGILGALVGGPIAGAIMGIGTTMLFKSKTFNEFLFGNEEEGRKGLLGSFKGILTKFNKSDSKENTSMKKKLGMGIVGAAGGALTGALISKVGIMGAMLGPGGLIGGALVGLGLSIKAQESGFREWLFGSKEKDENGNKKKVGVLEKFGNYLKVNVFSPIATRAKYIYKDIQNTIKYDVLEVTRLAFKPLADGIANFVTGTKKKGKEVFSKIGETVANKIKPVFEAITKPIAKVVDSAASLLYEGSKTIATFPFKVLGLITKATTSGVGKIVGGVHKYLIKPVRRFIFKGLKTIFNAYMVIPRLLWSGTKFLGRKTLNITGKANNKIGNVIHNWNVRRDAKREEIEQSDMPDNYSSLKKRRKAARARNKTELRDNKNLDKNRQLIYKWTNGERTDYTDENIRLAEMNARKAHKSINWKASKKDLTTAEKKAEILKKKTNDQLAGMKDTDLSVEERQVSILQKIYNFLQGKSPTGKRRGEEEDDSPVQEDESLADIDKELYNINASDGLLTRAFKRTPVYSALRNFKQTVDSHSNWFDNTNRRIKDLSRHPIDTIKAMASGDYQRGDKPSLRKWKNYLKKEGLTKDDLSYNDYLESFESLPHYAKGTDNAKPGQAVVGENKPEIVTFRGGEKVHSDMYKPIRVAIDDVSKKAQDKLNAELADPLKITRKSIINAQFNKREEEKKKEDAELDEARKKGSYTNKNKDDDTDDIKPTDSPETIQMKKMNKHQSKLFKLISPIMGLFSKKGLIGAGLILFLPKIASLIKSIGPTVVSLVSTVGKGLVNVAKPLMNFLGSLGGWKDMCKGLWDSLLGSSDKGKDSDRKDGQNAAESIKENVKRDVNLANLNIKDYVLNEDGEYDAQSGAKMNFLYHRIKNSVAGKAAKKVIVKTAGKVAAKKAAKEAVLNAGTDLTTDTIKDVAKEQIIKKTKNTLGEKGAEKFAERYATKTATKAITKYGTETLVKEGSEVAASKVANTVASEVTEKAAGGLKGKVIKMFEGFISKLCSKFGKEAAKKGATEGAEQMAKNQTGPIASKVVALLNKKFPAISAFVSAKLAGESTLAASTAGLGTLIKHSTESLILGLNELSNPRRLFQIPKGSKVDWKMKVIATCFGMFKGTTTGSILDVINSLVASVLQWNMFTKLASVLYEGLCKLTGDTKGYDKLVEKQEKQKEKYEDYKDKKYQEAYKKYLKKNNKSEDDLSYDDYLKGVESGKYKVKVKSYEDWNADQNKTIGAHIMSGVVKAGKGIKKGTKWAVSKTKKAAKNIKKFFTGGKVNKNNLISDIAEMSKSTKEVKCWVDKDNDQVYIRSGYSFEVYSLSTKKYIKTISKTKKVKEIIKNIENGVYEVATFPVKYLNQYLKNVDMLSKINPKAAEKLKKKYSDSEEDFYNKYVENTKNSKESGYAWFSNKDFSYYVEQTDGTWNHYAATGDLIKENVTGSELDTFMKERSMGIWVKEKMITISVQGKEFAKKIKKMIKSGKLSSDDMMYKIYENFVTEAEKTTDTTSSTSNTSGSGNGAFKLVNTTRKNNTIKNKLQSNLSGYGPDTVNDFKYFSQNDSKWRNNKYANSTTNDNATIGDAGCAPTSMSMVVSELTGNNVTPDKMSKFALSSGYRDSNGTNSKFIDSASDKFGLSDKRVTPTSQSVINELKHGNPVILNGMSDGSYNSPYTKRGHYIVAVGTDENGNIIVNDPRGINYSGTVSPEIIDSESRAAWSFKNKNVSGGSVGKTITTAAKVAHAIYKTPVGKKVVNRLIKRGIRRKLIGFGDETAVQKAQRAVCAWMYAIKEKNVYSQSNRSDADSERGLTGEGSGDCSSTVRWAYHKALGSDFSFGTSTASQIDNNSISGVKDIFPSSDGTCDISQLQCGDLVYFNEGGRKVSHVEMYVGDGTFDKTMGQGGKSDGNGGTAKGPYESTVSGNTAYFKKMGGGFVKARRFINETSIKGRKIKFPDGKESFVPSNSDATVENTSSTTTEGNDFFSSFSNGLSSVFDAVSTAGNNYLYGNSNAFDNKNIDFGTGTSSNNTTGSADVSNTDTSSQDAVKKAVWKYFRSNGYSAAATAGIMGNIEEESHFDPSSIQKNSKGEEVGPAAGLFQWENYNTKSGRFGGLNNLASQRNTTWTDLQTQLDYANQEINGLGYYFGLSKTINDRDKVNHYNAPATTIEGFKNSTDPTNAAIQFEKAFERAGKPGLAATRIPKATEYYNQYKDVDISGMGEGSNVQSDDNSFTRLPSNVLRNEARSSEITNKITNQNQLNKIVDTSKMERLLSDVVDVLKSINTNTNDSSKKLDNIRTNNNIIVSGNNGRNNSTIQNVLENSNDISNIDMKKDTRNYDLASLIALG